MKYQVVVSHRADAEIRAAATWWSKHRSDEQAKRWLTEIERAVESLSRNPERGTFAPENAIVSRELREVYTGLSNRKTHRIVFKIHQNVVLVLSVRHTAQDWLRHEDISIE